MEALVKKEGGQAFRTLVHWCGITTKRNKQQINDLPATVDKVFCQMQLKNTIPNTTSCESITQCRNADQGTLMLCSVSLCCGLHLSARNGKWRCAKREKKERERKAHAWRTQKLLCLRVFLLQQYSTNSKMIWWYLLALLNILLSNFRKTMMLSWVRVGQNWFVDLVGSCHFSADTYFPLLPSTLLQQQFLTHTTSNTLPWSFVSCRVSATLPSWVLWITKECLR